MHDTTQYLQRNDPALLNLYDEIVRKMAKTADLEIPEFQFSSDTSEILHSSMDWPHNKQASGDDLNTSEVNSLFDLARLSIPQSGLRKEQKTNALEDAKSWLRIDDVFDLVIYTKQEKRTRIEALRKWQHLLSYTKTAINWQKEKATTRQTDWRKLYC
jgi:hypothetical protein